jgi:hypothetical protein
VDYGFFYSWSGKMLGGRASPVELRAVLAWGSVPIVIGLAICHSFDDTRAVPRPTPAAQLVD